MAKNDIERDAHDHGVPMLPASEARSEPTGPEDALGFGPKRGDYTNRLGGSAYNPHTVVSVEQEDEDGNPTTNFVDVPQKPLASNRGDETGVKGGHGTHTDAAAAEAAQKARSGSGQSGKGK